MTAFADSKYLGRPSKIDALDQERLCELVSLQPHGKRRWTVRALADRLNIPPALCMTCWERLSCRGAATCRGTGCEREVDLVTHSADPAVNYDRMYPLWRRTLRSWRIFPRR
jgi:hypothetical protein